MQMGILNIDQRIPVYIFLFPSLTVADRQIPIPFLDLVPRPLGVFSVYHVLPKVSNFYLLPHTRCNFLRGLVFLDRL